MEKAEASALALKFVNEQCSSPSIGEVVLLDQFGVRTKLGWVFSYQTRSFVETGDIMKSLIGNGPVLVRDVNGEVWPFPSGFGVERLARMIEEDDPDLRQWMPS